MDATSYIITFRGGDPRRRANLAAVLQWLQGHALADVIVVEQDSAPTLGDLPEAAGLPNLRRLFAYNPGPFNKGWGFNIGVRASRGSVLVFGDADVVCRELDAAVATCRAGHPAVRPFHGLCDLDDERSRWLRDDLSCLTDPSFPGDMPDRSALGEEAPFASGVVVMHRSVVHRVGGWDERFLGWGAEDDAMTAKLERTGVPLLHLDNDAGYHLAHARAGQDQGTAPSDHPHYADNVALLRQIRLLPDAAFAQLCEFGAQICGDIDMHRPAEER